MNLEIAVNRAEIQDRHTSFLEPTVEAAKKNISPDIMPGLEHALRLIDKQAIDNFRVIHPKGAPGVSYTATTLRITPDIVRAITGKISNISSQTLSINEASVPTMLHKKDEKLLYFVTPPFSNQQDATVHLDEGYNLFMRNLSKVAGAMKRGESVPEIEIHLLGSTDGLGGKETARSLFTRLINGPKEHAKYYAEYLRNHVPQDSEHLKKTRIVLEGISRGVSTADQAYQYLPSYIKDRTQVKLELPTDKVSGVDLAIRFGKEMVWQGKNNPFFPTQKKAGIGFSDYMIEKYSLDKDGLRQTIAKLAGFAIDTGHLLKGTKIHTENRKYIVQGTEDPMADQESLRQAVNRIGQPILLKPEDENKSTEEKRTLQKYVQFAHIKEEASTRFPFKGRHFYAASQRFNRWESILRYSKSAVDFLNKTT